MDEYTAAQVAHTLTDIRNHAEVQTQLLWWLCTKQGMISAAVPLPIERSEDRQERLLQRRKK